MSEAHYKAYHVAMTVIGDCDPAYPILDYIADRFELNIEQRYWLAFLYQTVYNTASAYYLIQEFPDFENVTEHRLNLVWSKHKSKIFFQTDRQKIKNFNQFVPMILSYKELVDGMTQQEFFESTAAGKDARIAYDHIYKLCGRVRFVGRFSQFLWLESMHRLTGLPIMPTGLDLRNASSCRNGLLYALDRKDMLDRNLTKDEYSYLDERLDKIVIQLQQEYDVPIDYWSVETSLCAYKKLFRNTRYLSYYIDRMQEEIQIMEKSVTNGVDWSVLWQAREEYFDHRYLGEKQGWKGIRKHKFGLPSTKELLTALDCTHKRKIIFRGAKEVYA